LPEQLPSYIDNGLIHIGFAAHEKSKQGKINPGKIKQEQLSPG
jgi:hypothetical protein